MIAKTRIKDDEEVGSIVLHLGTNDMKSETTKTVTDLAKTALQKVLDK